MDKVALILVLVGSLLHLGWNALAKSAEDKLAFMWLALLIPSVYGFAVLLLEITNGITNPTPWICLVISAIIHMFYFYALMGAYRVANLSFVYPFSRGTSALLATSIGILLLGEGPSLLGGIGIALTILAIFLISVFKIKASADSKPGIIFGAATGLTIACYLIVDKIGVAFMPSYKYMGAQFFLIAVGFAPIMFKNARFKKELARSFKRPLLASFFMASGYGVVLAAMKIAPVSYVVSARATGIIVSGVAGMVFFKEELGGVDWISIALITAGVVCIGFG